MSICIECRQLSKYKCPTCCQPYCSVACYKRHKENPCIAAEKSRSESPVENRTQYEYPTDDTVAEEKLDLLRKSTEVRKCLENRHVRDILLLLDKSPHPDQLIQEYMQEPIFTELVDACLNVVQTTDNDNKISS